MGAWLGYVQVPAGGTYTMWVEGGNGSICVPERGFVTLTDAPTQVTFAQAGDYPVNLYAAVDHPETAFRCDPHVTLRAMQAPAGGGR